MFAITALYAAPLALLFVWLSARVIMRRRDQLIAYGPGEDSALLQRMRVQANFAEYTPIALVLMMIAESINSPVIFVHMVGLLLIFGRFIHGVGLSLQPLNMKIRVMGMALTFTAIGLAAVVVFLIAIIQVMS